MTTKFSLGRIVTTPGVSDLAEGREAELLILMGRHLQGDWGDVSAEDRERNNQALIDGERLLSAYRLGGKKIWIITEHDRSSTCALLPEEY
jgi:hypothetical protein